MTTAYGQRLLAVEVGRPVVAVGAEPVGDHADPPVPELAEVPADPGRGAPVVQPDEVHTGQSTGWSTTTLGIGRSSTAVTYGSSAGIE